MTKLKVLKDDYLYRNILILRIPILTGVFFRLNIIEQISTGIDRTNEKYKSYFSKEKRRTKSIRNRLFDWI